MRRKSRPRVVWLPQDPFFSIDSAGLAQSTVMRIDDTLGASGNPGESATVIAPCVLDSTPSVLTQDKTLADINNSGYRLRRIVGKIWVGTDTRGNDGGPAMVVTTAGFIVLRTSPATGSQPLDATAANYATDVIDNTQDPWIWRRSWLYGNQEEAAGFIRQGTVALASPVERANNVSINGVADGPHVDAKTARVIGPEERLFLVFTTTVVESGNQGITMNVQYFYDIRYLASMRTMVGNRRNATR